MLFILVVFVGIIAAIFFSAFVKANRRMQYADTRSAMRAVSSGGTRPPSWIRDKNRVHEFYGVVGKFAVHKGVPQDFVAKAMATVTNVSLGLTHCAGAMEAQGASFNAQKLAAADMLFTMWSNTTAEERRLLLAAPDDDEQEESDEASPNGPRSMLDEIDEFTERVLGDAKREIEELRNS